MHKKPKTKPAITKVENFGNGIIIVWHI